MREILVRNDCSDCDGRGCDACSGSGKVEQWVPVEQLALEFGVIDRSIDEPHVV